MENVFEGRVRGQRFHGTRSKTIDGRDPRILDGHMYILGFLTISLAKNSFS